VKEKSSWIQAAFLVGWALGGGFFGRVGDRAGRSRALSLTILTYALCTGLSALAQTWWQLLIFRFLAALGIGGEWAAGASLLTETWPRRWRPWVAAVLQTGVNIGVLGACATVYLVAGRSPRYVFLVGILPAFLTFWIRRAVPETAEWREAKKYAGASARAASARRIAAPGAPGEPAVADLFRGAVRRTTLLTMVVCACSLTAWWAFLFWNPQHLWNLPELAAWTEAQRSQLVSRAFSLMIAVSMAGNFFGGALARWLGYRRAIILMFAGFFAAMAGAFLGTPHCRALAWGWFPAVGFFSGVFGLFTMYLPPLFPPLLRTTGAGFSYNVGRIAAACGTVFFGLFAHVGDFRAALLYASFLFVPAMLFALLLPEQE
jgi:MFS family permease